MHRQGMLMFLSRGRAGCASDLAEPLLLKAHSLTGKTLESKEQWRTCIPHIPKDGDPLLSCCPCLHRTWYPSCHQRETGLAGLLGSLAAPRICLAQQLQELAPLWGKHAASMEHLSRTRQAHSKNYFYWKRFASTKE